jgi:phosphoglycolate phosphatase
LPEVTQQQVNDWIGHGTRELLISALAYVQHKPIEAVRSDALLPAYLAEFDVHYQQRCGTRSHLYPQVRETLTALFERGVKLAVVTNKEGRYTTTVLNAHNLMPCCTAWSAATPCRSKNPTRRVSTAAWSNLAWPPSAPCLWATRPSM